jgi:hypothetical protein
MMLANDILLDDEDEEDYVGDENDAMLETMSRCS